MDEAGESTAAAIATPAIPVAVRLPHGSRWFAMAGAAMGLLAMIGWVTQIEILKTVLPGLVTMKVNTALSLILLGAALVLADRPGRGSKIAFFSVTAVCFIIPLLTAVEYLFHIDAHIDNALFQDRAGIAFPGRMAPTTICCLILSAFSLLLLHLRRAVAAAQVVLGMVICISLATLGGYLYGAPQMLAHAPYPVVALHTALALVLLAIGGLLQRPTEGPMRVMTADTTGGWIARRLIPTSLLVPLTVGLCVVTGQRAGLYGPAFAVALTVSADITVMTAVIWSISAELSHADTLRQRSDQAAEQHSRLKDNFLATLSHELRTPLMSILGWAVLLSERDDLDQETRQAMEVIERNARAQTQIIEDLLDMSRIISGKMRLEMQLVDLRKVISAAIQTARPAATAREIQIRETLCGDVPAVMGDPNRLQQIAWNLLSNAVKFTPRGGEVRVELDRCGSQVRLAIADNGQGIGKEFLPHLFERFRQADGGTTRRYGGLGLGLSIVRELMELHGGTVEAASAGKGLGAVFTARFPIPATVVAATSEGDTSAARLATHSLGFASAQAVKGLRVLVVDDEADARSLIRRVLEDCQAIVVTAAGADDAIAHLDSEQFDVLVCDIGMPDRDGYDLIRAIRRRDDRAGGKVPAAALTAFARNEDRVRALACGFQLHTCKPIEPSELIATVAALSRRSRLN